MKKATENQALIQHEHKVEFFKNSNNELPFIQKLEFRTQTEDFDPNTQQYRIRLSPTGRKERREQRNFNQATLENIAAEKSEILQNALLDRYDFLLDWRDWTASLALLQQQKLILEDRITVYQKQALAIDFDVQNLITTEDVLHNVEQDILEDEIKLKRLQRILQQEFSVNEKMDFDTSNWISFSELQNRITNLKNVAPSHPLFIQNQSEIALIESEKQLEIAREKQWFDFVETRYQNNPNNPFNEEFSIGVGIEIPFKNQARLDVNELELERLEEQQSLTSDTIKLKERIIEIHDRLDLLFQQHALISTQLKNSQAQYSFDQFQQMTLANPLALLKIQESLLRRKISLQKIENRAFEYYVELLDLTGKVVEMPLRNYLRRDLEAF